MEVPGDPSGHRAPAYSFPPERPDRIKHPLGSPLGLLPWTVAYATRSLFIRVARPAYRALLSLRWSAEALSLSSGGTTSLVWFCI
jgi:hypothetical protein